MDWHRKDIMSIATIIGIIASALTVLVLWMQGASRRRKEEFWKQLKVLESDYRKALAQGDPQEAAQISKRMQELRDKYKYLGV